MMSHIFQSDPGWLVELSLVTVISRPPNEPDNDDDDENEEDDGEEEEEPGIVREPDEAMSLVGPKPTCNSCWQMSAYRGKDATQTLRNVCC